MKVTRDEDGRKWKVPGVRKAAPIKALKQRMGEDEEMEITACIRLGKEDGERKQREPKNLLIWLVKEGNTTFPLNLLCSVLTQADKSIRILTNNRTDKTQTLCNNPADSAPELRSKLWTDC